MRHVVLCAAALMLAACSTQSDTGRLTSSAAAQKMGSCGVHAVRMERRTVAVTFGYPYYEGPFTRASRRFPNALEEVNGGCDPTLGPKTAKKYVCPVCERAARDWALKHPNDVMGRQILEQTNT